MELFAAFAVSMFALVGVSVAILVWRDKRRRPVCPACGRRNTFGPHGEDDVCDHCGLSLRSYDY